jgi:hypothetical protein
VEYLEIHWVAVCSFPRFRNQPLISCVMPTPGRLHFVAQAIAYFRRQDYPNRELVIVH